MALIGYLFVFSSFLRENLFGFNLQNLRSLYKGSVKGNFKNFKYLRQTRCTQTLLMVQNVIPKLFLLSKKSFG